MATPDASEDESHLPSASVSSRDSSLRSHKRPRLAAPGKALPSASELESHASASQKLQTRNYVSSRWSVAASPSSTSKTLPLAARQTELSSKPVESSKASLAVPKRRFTRSRSGCSTCRTRKVKCDEARPRCRRCIEDGRLCQGYSPHRPSKPHQSQSSAPAETRPPSDQDVSLTSQQPSQSLRGQHLTASSEVVSPYPMTSPQHLDDWIDLLCSSIGNDIPQSSNSNASTSAASFAYLDRTASHKQMPRLLEDQAQRPEHPSHMHSARSATEQGLSTLASAAAGIAPTPLQPDSPGWMNEDWLSILTASPADSQLADTSSNKSSSSSSTRSKLPALDRISEPDLQKRIRALCVTKVQLESVSFFFNTTARCFHLLSADTNVWRIFFAQLASESPVILDLVGCLGLTHLSLTHDHRKKGLAHAHFSRCKTEWDGMIGSLESPAAIDRALAQVTTAYRVLEVLAGTILIAHIEQFSRGFAICSRAYTALAIAVIRKSFNSSSSPWLDDLDQGPGSAFRFFVRILLWWETMSRTMGPASEQGDMLDMFECVYRWEEPDNPSQDPIGCSTQCVVGWPLDLLEAVERITRLSLHPEIVSFQSRPPASPPLVMPSSSLSHALEGSISLQLQQQVDTIETQIRLARPLPLVQDDSIAAELRYLIFECLQSAALVYLCRMLLKSTDAVWFEIDKVTRFLERKQQRADQPDPAFPTRTALTGNSTTCADLQLTQAMEMRGKWWIRAPDGALIWAYFQCASEIFGALDPSVSIMPCSKGPGGRQQFGSGKPISLASGSQLTLGSDAYSVFAQSRSERRQRCRRSLLLWEKFDEIQCVFLCRHLLKAIWDRRDLYELETSEATAKDTSSTDDNTSQVRYDQVSELRDICRQRRWKQPLVF